MKTKKRRFVYAVPLWVRHPETLEWMKGNFVNGCVYSNKTEAERVRKVMEERNNSDCMYGIEKFELK